MTVVDAAPRGALERAAVPADPDAPVGAPLYPPAEWFARPAGLQPGHKLTVITEGPEAGRVFGYVAPKRQCILSGREQKECWTVPDSPTNYAAAMQGDALTADGAIVPIANVGGEVDHAPIGWTNFRKIRDHYSNTASQVMRVAYGADDVGVWAAGVLWPEITHRQAAKVRASALSGDWRWRQELGAYDMAGSQMVSTPGFPLIPTIHARAASLGDEHPPLLGGWGGAYIEEAQMGDHDEPTVTLTLTASESARLHAILTGSAPLTVNQAFTAGTGDCACGGHTAASPVGQMMSGDGLASALDDEAAPTGPPTREEFDALALEVEELRGQIMSDALGEVDAMVAALPLPPELDDDERWKMPEAKTAAFDESKHPRHAKGKEGGGRFAPKVGDRVVVNTDQGKEEGEVVSKSDVLPGEQERLTVKFDDGTQSSWNGAQVTTKEVADASGNAADDASLADYEFDELVAQEEAEERGVPYDETTARAEWAKRQEGYAKSAKGDGGGDPQMESLRRTVDATKNGDWQTANKLNAEALADRPAQTKAAGDFAKRQMAAKPKGGGGAVKWEGVAFDKGTVGRTDDGYTLDVIPDGPETDPHFQWEVYPDHGDDDVDPASMVRGDASSVADARKQAEAALEKMRAKG